MVEQVNAKEIWLNYFNSVLYEKGIISEAERNKMTQLIRKKCRTSKRVGDIKKNASRENFS